LSQFNDKPEGGGDSANLNTTGLNHFYDIFAQIYLKSLSKLAASYNQ